MVFCGRRENINTDFFNQICKRDNVTDIYRRFCKYDLFGRPILKPFQDFLARYVHTIILCMASVMFVVGMLGLLIRLYLVCQNKKCLCCEFADRDCSLKIGNEDLKSNQNYRLPSTIIKEKMIV
jgi:hypothetical protein